MMYDKKNSQNCESEAAADQFQPASPAERLTWAVLLARWTEFARGSVALPDHGVEGAFKRSVSDVITLQAVWFALRDLDQLDPAERALGLDRAAVLIDRSESAIRQRFADAPLPDMLEQLIRDARAAVEQ